MLVAYLWPKMRRTRASAALSATSPNQAENLLQSHELGVGAGIATQDQLFPAGPGDNDTERIRPGLPDFFRGA